VISLKFEILIINRLKELDLQLLDYEEMKENPYNQRKIRQIESIVEINKKLLERLQANRIKEKRK